MHAGFDYGVVKEILAESSSQPCASELLKRFLPKDLLAEAGRLSFFHPETEKWYHDDDLEEWSKKINAKLTRELFRKFSGELRGTIDRLRGENKGQTYVFQSGSFRFPPELFNGMQVRLIDYEGSILNGGNVLRQRRQETKEAIWKDHLPELSLNVGWTKFDLVRHETVPERKRVHQIDIPASFVLIEGQPEYHFQLKQGDRQSRKHFAAVLRSKAFPLREDVKCRLDLTYTYGADSPYDLKFIPVDPGPDKAGFTFVEVKWEEFDPATAIDLDKLPVPTFPSPHSWQRLQHFQGDKKKEPTDLLDWLTRDYKRLQDITSSLVMPQRYHETIATQWRDLTDKNGNTYRRCRTEEGTSLASFVFPNDLVELPGVGDVVCFSKDHSGKPFKAVPLSDEKEYLAEMVRRLEDRRFEKALEQTERLFRSWRFPLYTVWRGHAPSDADIPPDFLLSTRSAIITAERILVSDEYPQELQDECLLFLSCLHGDSSEQFRKILLEIAENENLYHYWQHIACSLGSADHEWQRRILDIVMSLWGKPVSLSILTMAVWRSEGLIYRIPFAKNHLNYLQKTIQGDFDKHQTVRSLELLLAILRLRKSKDERMRRLLVPNTELADKFRDALYGLDRTVRAKNIVIKSRLEMKLDKPEERKDMPDLIYALLMYLTGETGADSIRIIGVKEDA